MRRGGRGGGGFGMVGSNEIGNTLMQGTEEVEGPEDLRSLTLRIWEVARPYRFRVSILLVVLCTCGC